MRVFVWEYLTSGGGGESPPSPLAAEGAMMARALARDLAAVPGVTVVLARVRTIDLGPLPCGVETVELDAAADPWPLWRAIVARSDAVWPIAPETDGILERALELVAREGRTALAGSIAAAALARSKRATGERLAAAGIGVPSAGSPEAPPPAAQGWVVKPDDGAGALDTWHVVDRAALARWRGDAAAPLVQPYVPGEPLSLSLLVAAGAAWLLACNRQCIESHGGRFRFRGAVVGGAEQRRAVLEPLAQRIAAALPGLWGHVGVDLIDGPDGPVVVDVNPRVTTSYLGLAESLGVNPAALALELRWRPLAELRRPLAPRPVAVEVAT